MRENDILFFNLHRRYLNTNPSYGGFLGIYLLAAFLNHNGYAAQSYNGNLTAGKEWIDRACREGKVRMIGLYCDYENVTENIFLSRYIKETYHLPVIIGGPQATAFNAGFLADSQCDAAVLYEGELTCVDLLDCLLDGVKSKSDIQGIAYLENGELKRTPLRPVIKNLDALPFITPDCYLEPPAVPMLSLMTGRGCPFHCAFCHEGSHTRQVRFRSVENVLSEIDQFLARCNKGRRPYILFTDDTFTLRTERVKVLCEGLRERRKKRDFSWFCEGHIHTLYTHPEMIRYIAEGGAQRIQLGIEAGTQEVLDAYRKGSTLDEIREVVRRCRDAGIKQIFSNIILAGAYYNREVYEKNLAFAKELISLGKGCVEIGVVSYWPLAQTSMTLQPARYGLKIVDPDFLTACGDFPQVETEDFSRWDIHTMVQSMQKALRQHMINMLRHNEVPRENIDSWFENAVYKGAVGQWWFCLQSQQEIYNYYDMLRSGEAVTMNELGSHLEEAHPMRVIAMDAMAAVTDQEGLKVGNCILKGAERFVFILSTGKLSVKDIIGYMKVHQMTGSEENLEEIVYDTLQKLEKNHLIVYSRY